MTEIRKKHSKIRKAKIRGTGVKKINRDAGRDLNYISYRAF